MSQKKFNINELDFNNIGNWPQNAKVVFGVVLALFIVIMGYLLVFRGQQEELAGLERKEVELRADFEKEQGRAVNLEPLKQQLAQMEQVLQQMLRQLPSKTEMPDLIIDVSQTALSSGLNNELFQPGVVGSYHQFGAFVSGVASLPRVVILTMHDINLKPHERGGVISRNGALVLDGTVKTYRYLDEQEMDDQQVADAAKGAK